MLFFHAENVVLFLFHSIQMKNESGWRNGDKVLLETYIMIESIYALSVVLGEAHGMVCFNSIKIHEKNLIWEVNLLYVCLCGTLWIYVEACGRFPYACTIYINILGNTTIVSNCLLRMFIEQYNYLYRIRKFGTSCEAIITLPNIC